MRRRAWTKALQHSFALAGAALLIASVGGLGEGWLFQWRPQLFAHLPASNVKNRQVLVENNPIPPLPVLAAETDSPKAQQILGRFEIPRLHVSTLVVEGDSEQSLRLGIGHVPGSSLAGQHGNTVLAGHRDTFFRCLRRIRIGDEVDFAMAGNRNRYRVIGARIVSPTDVSVMKSSDAEQLTLITCYPFGFVGNAPSRLVVDATPLSRTASAAD